MKSGDSWARTLASGECYHCTCKGSFVDCSLVGCAGCPHGILKAHVPGKCCPQCRPGECTPLRSFANRIFKKIAVNFVTIK